MTIFIVYRYLTKSNNALFDRSVPQCIIDTMTPFLNNPSEPLRFGIISRNQKLENNCKQEAQIHILQISQHS